MTSNFPHSRNRIMNTPREAAARARLLAPAVAVGLSLLASNANAAYAGEQMLKYFANYFIGPLGLISIVAALAAAMFQPQFVMKAVGSAIICAVIFFMIRNGDTIIQQMQTQ